MSYTFCGNSSPALMISLFTWVIRNLQPLEVTKPCRFKITVISDKDFPCMSNECNMAMALILFGLLSALVLLVFTLSTIARSRLFVRFSDLPSLHPLAFLACSDCLVLWLISPASYSAMLLIICSTSLFASGKSQNTISTSCFSAFSQSLYKFGSVGFTSTFCFNILSNRLFILQVILYNFSLSLHSQSGDFLFYRGLSEVGNISFRFHFYIF